MKPEQINLTSHNKQSVVPCGLCNKTLCTIPYCDYPEQLSAVFYRLFIVMYGDFKIVQVLPVQNYTLQDGTEKEKRSLVLEETKIVANPDSCVIDFMNDKVSLLDSFNRGDIVRVYYSMRATTWKDKDTGDGRGTTHLYGFRIEHINDGAIK